MVFPRALFLHFLFIFYILWIWLGFSVLWVLHSISMPTVCKRLFMAWRPRPPRLLRPSWLWIPAGCPQIIFTLIQTRLIWLVDDIQLAKLGIESFHLRFLTCFLYLSLWPCKQHILFMPLSFASNLHSTSRFPLMQLLPWYKPLSVLGLTLVMPLTLAFPLVIPCSFRLSSTPPPVF